MGERLHIRHTVIVEGKYDKIKLEPLIDATILTTGGFGIFTNTERLALFRTLAKRTGLLILTDSDAAGFRIRNFLKGAVNEGEIRHVYIPDLLGKERRKAQPSKEGKLGVEGIPAPILRDVLTKAGVLEEALPPKQDPITRLDLYEDGLTGGQDSVDKREALLNRLSLPRRLSTTALLDMLNLLLTREEYRSLLRELHQG